MVWPTDGVTEVETEIAVNRREPPQPAGAWIVTEFGAVFGGCLAGVVGYGLGAAYVALGLPDGRLTARVLPLLGAGAGLWAGAVLGCWLVLRLSGVGRARLTAGALLVILPVVTLWFLNVGGADPLHLAGLLLPTPFVARVAALWRE